MKKKQKIISIVLFTIAIVSGASKSFAGEKFLVVAGGCFWCMEKPYEKTDGVIDVISGYSGGGENTANYKTVSSGKTKHREAVKITYDDSKVSIDKLLDIFWHNVDPFDKKGQFCDKGFQYTSAIYYQNDIEKKKAEDSLNEVKAKFRKDIETKIEPYNSFYAAEDYHQDYYKKNPIRYHFYRSGCGRDKRLEEVWGSKP